jgi:Xaa-Pro aminopeptidase
MDRFEPPADWAIVADARHLMYLANWPVEPFSWAWPPPGLLLIERDGSAMLVVDNLAARHLDTLWVERVEVVPWYNHADSPGDRRGAVIDHLLRRLPAARPATIAIETRAVPVELIWHFADALSDASVAVLDDALLAMRAVKDMDEVELLRRCIRAGEAGHARAWEVVRPGVTELDVYREVAGACMAAAGMPVVVYGDFCSGPRTWLERGGPPTDRRLEAGDLMILDFSVVIGGYRGDFTNTIAVGGRPTPEQQRLFRLCMHAMDRGEQSLRPGASAAAIWHAVNDPLESTDSGYRLPGHAGHGIGLAHPEPPILVPRSTDAMAAGNVITLEPGVYVAGIGGMRFEHNYLVTAGGFERLSNHLIALTRP